ncbi:MAG: anti-sigma factor [Chloroflexota bacterium]
MSELGKETPTEEEIRDLLPGYALGILEPDELLTVDDYLAAHPELVAEIDSLQEISSQLAYAAPSALPPVDAKEHIIARAEAERTVANRKRPIPLLGKKGVKPGEPQWVSSLDLRNLNRPKSSMPSTTAIAGPVDKRSSETDLAETKRIGPQMAGTQSTSVKATSAQPSQASNNEFDGRWHNGLGWRLYALGATAAIVLLVLMFTQARTTFHQRSAELTDANVQLRQLASENSELLAERDKLLSENESLQSINEQLRLDNRQYAQSPLPEKVIAAQKVVALRGTNPASSARGSLLVDAGSGYLVLEGLERLSKDQVYQLWLIPDDGAPVSSGLIELDENGTASLDINLTLDMDDFSAVGLSIEPAGGSPAPTADQIVLFGQGV